MCEREDFRINEAIGINDYTMPIQGFPDPFINCTFISDDLIAVILFYNYSRTHYHFLYNQSTHQIEGTVNQM